jgi:hypothetical protein
MQYWVNQDTPTKTTIHQADSPDSRCHPRDKSPANGRWHWCQSEEDLIRLVRQLRQHAPQARWHRCQVCMPAVPDELGLW